MIRLQRPSAAPEILRTAGRRATRANRARYRLAPAAYRTGKRKFPFDRTIYGHAEVKRRLIEMQHGKCCYCETKFRHSSPGDVEHFRPKGASQQGSGAPLLRPGYYWLAYAWENLFFVCESCNRSGKRNRFPLADDARRARSHADALTRETPLLVHPVDEEPADFLTFKGEVPVPTPGNHARGMATVRTLRLKRRELTDDRLVHLRHLRFYQRMVATHPDPVIVAEAKGFLRAAVREDAEYAAMARAALPEYWPPVVC